MKNSEKLGPAYIEAKRARLLKLRDQLRRATAAEESRRHTLQQESAQHAHEYEDDAQKLDMLENSNSLLRHDAERLAQINRALRKIDEGTYGYSDISGQRIAADRLDVLPEAANTLQEQQARE